MLQTLWLRFDFFFSLRVDFSANFLDEKKIIERKLDQNAHFEREGFLKSFRVLFEGVCNIK